MYLYISYKNQSLNENDLDIKNNVNNLFKLDYIQQKIKELLFKVIPELIHAATEILKLCYKLILNFSKEYLKKTKDELNLSNTKNFIKNLFNEIYKFINVSFEKKSEDLLVVNKSSIQKVTVSDNEIMQTLREYSDQSSSFTIEINDLQTINDICQHGKTKIFAIENEDNYICLPMSDNHNNITAFEAIKMSVFYKQHYQVSDDQFAELIDIAKDFVHKHDIIKLAKNKQNVNYDLKTFAGIKVMFKYYKHEQLKKLNYGGLYIDKAKLIEIPFSDLSLKSFGNKDYYFIHILTCLVHEGLHDLDFTQDDKLGNLTNVDIEEFLFWISDVYGDKKIIPLKKMKEDMKSFSLKYDKNISYLLAIAEKNNFISFIPPDFKNIKILVNKNVQKLSQEKIHDMLPTEYNTVLSDCSFSFIRDNYDKIFGLILTSSKDQKPVEDFEKTINNLLKEEISQKEIKNIALRLAKQIIKEKSKISSNKLNAKIKKEKISQYQDNIFKKLIVLIQRNILMIYKRKIKNTVQ